MRRIFRDKWQTVRLCILQQTFQTDFLLHRKGRFGGDLFMHGFPIMALKLCRLRQPQRLIR